MKGFTRRLGTRKPFFSARLFCTLRALMMSFPLIPPESSYEKELL